MLELGETEARQRFERLVQLPFVEKFPGRKGDMRNIHEAIRLATGSRRIAQDRGKDCLRSCPTR